RRHRRCVNIDVSSVRELGMNDVSSREVVWDIRWLTELLVVQGVDRRRVLYLDPGLVALALADEEGAGLAAVGFQQGHLERRGVDAVFRRLVAGRRGDRLPLERPERVEQIVHGRGLRRAPAALDQLPVALTAALDHDRLAPRAP